ncbi:MAG: hybrid sensor histidine kinase/response regulator [Calditrichaeota bacterium]|nr:MAG: hybrid sensor histidine kinase/response regulator [Calditrichota bacterium]
MIKKTRHLIHFLMVNEKFLQRVKSQLHYLERNSSQNVYSLETSIDKLMEEAKKLLLLPFDSISRGFPKMVRDLATSLGKKAEITIEGKEVEIDKRILEEMKDPLIHLIRNSVDHGLEYPEERIRLGKPAQGKITLRVSPRDSGKVEILVSDDGAGIDVEKVKKAALENGIISEKIAHSMTEEEALSLIFISRISTSEIITEISGRGMGMSIVKEKVENLGGEIKVSTKPNLGTTFRLILPLTLVRFRGILLEAANRLFIIPTTQVERVLRVKKDQVKTVKNIPTISLEGQVISLVSLAEVLGISSPQDNPDTPFLTLFLLNGNEQKIAFACDRIIAEQEVVVKGLGKQLLKVKNISGATVLGNGKVVPVLKPGDLLKSAHAMVKRGIITHQPKQEEQPKKRILVVDDSITSRSLISHILDAAGYEVETAIDGVEALERLKGGSFQLVVSDVEMPRMNGYELTATIRQEAKLENLPVILVTSRGSKADMEAGIEAGADAYIVKSNFDQSNLLETIRRFI